MKQKQGKVYLLGAGPGDPDLITLKGIKKLKIADVVVYDRLISSELLAYCKDDCEKIYVGKESGYHPIEQNKISEIIINKAKSGLTVVRLKGGDPFVFGRGSEEALALSKADIEFEIIPGITSGLASPIYSGIPITHRGLISQCLLVTGHEAPDKPGSQVEWKQIAKMKNTSIIIYMGASRIKLICNTLINYGMDAETPAAVIENGTLPFQRTVAATLKNIPGEFERQKFHPPCIIMISPTIQFRNEINWLEKKPLFNKKIIALGSDSTIDNISTILSDNGAEVIRFPVTKNKFDTEFISYLTMSDADCLLFANISSVKNFFDTFGAKVSTELLQKIRVVVTNSKIKQALAERNIFNVSIASKNILESICEFLCELNMQIN